MKKSIFAIFIFLMIINFVTPVCAVINEDKSEKIIFAARSGLPDRPNNEHIRRAEYSGGGTSQRFHRRRIGVSRSAHSFDYPYQRRHFARFRRRAQKPERSGRKQNHSAPLNRRRAQLDAGANYRRRRQASAQQSVRGGR